MQEKFQVVVIGGGPGGYVAAIRASQLGFSVAVVEKESMGGVCLNWGCIPTKALLQSAHLLQEIEKASTFGIVAEKPKPDFPAIIQRSRGVADQMSKGVTFLMKKNKVTVFSGEATFTDPHTIRINGKDKIQADYFIIATGARAREFPGVPFDKEIILSSREAMVEKQIPGRLAIIGAGAIGVEFADFYASMGSDVTIIEYLPHVLPNEDSEVCVALERSFKKRNITMKLSSSVTKIETKNSKAFLSIKPNSGKEDEETLEFDKVIVGIGLSPNTVGIGLEEGGVKLDSK
ncbi:MAG: FAD-dependent oxidoreductase, partial [Spirochaetota bacterium]